MSVLAIPGAYQAPLILPAGAADATAATERRDESRTESVFGAAPATPSSASCLSEALVGVEAGQSEHKARAASTSKCLHLPYIDTKSETSE